MADPPAPTGDYIMASRKAASLIISSGYDKEGQFKDKQVPFDEVSQSQEEKSIQRKQKERAEPFPESLTSALRTTTKTNTPMRSGAPKMAATPSSVTPNTTKTPKSSYLTRQALKLSSRKKHKRGQSSLMNKICPQAPAMENFNPCIDKDVNEVKVTATATPEVTKDTPVIKFNSEEKVSNTYRFLVPQCNTIENDAATLSAETDQECNQLSSRVKEEEAMSCVRQAYETAVETLNLESENKVRSTIQASIKDACESARTYGRINSPRTQVLEVVTNETSQSNEAFRPKGASSLQRTTVDEQPKTPSTRLFFKDDDQTPTEDSVLSSRSKRKHLRTSGGLVIPSSFSFEGGKGIFPNEMDGWASLKVGDGASKRTPTSVSKSSNYSTETRGESSREMKTNPSAGVQTGFDEVSTKKANNETKTTPHAARDRVIKELKQRLNDGSGSVTVAQLAANIEIETDSSRKGKNKNFCDQEEKKEEDSSAIFTPGHEKGAYYPSKARKSPKVQELAGKLEALSANLNSMSKEERNEDEIMLVDTATLVTEKNKQLTQPMQELPTEDSSKFTPNAAKKTEEKKSEADPKEMDFEYTNRNEENLSNTNTALPSSVPSDTVQDNSALASTRMAESKNLETADDEEDEDEAFLPPCIKSAIIQKQQMSTENDRDHGAQLRKEHEEELQSLKNDYERKLDELREQIALSSSTAKMLTTAAKDGHVTEEVTEAVMAKEKETTVALTTNEKETTETLVIKEKEIVNAVEVKEKEMTNADASLEKNNRFTSPNRPQITPSRRTKMSASPANNRSRLHEVEKENMRKQIALLEKQARKSKEAHEKALSQLRRASENEIIRIKKVFEKSRQRDSKKDALNESLFKAASKEKDELLEKVAKLEAKKEDEDLKEIKEREILVQKIAALQQKESSLVEEHEKALNDIRDKNEKEIKCLEDHLMKMGIEKEEKLRLEITESFSNEKLDMANKIETLEGLLESERSEQANAAALEKEVQESKRRHEKEVQESKRRHEEEVTQMRTQSEIKIKQLQDALEQKACLLESEHDGAVLAGTRVAALEKEVKESKRQHIEEVTQLQLQSEIKAKQLQMALEQKAAADKTMDLVAREKEELCERIAKLEDSEKKIRESRTQEITEKHTKELDELLAQLDLVEAEHRDKLADVKSDLESARREVKDSQGEIESLKKEMQIIADANLKVTKEAEAMREKACEAAREEMIQRAEAQFKQANDLYMKLKKQYDTSKGKVEKLENELQHTKSQLVTAQRGKDTFSADLKAELAELRALQANTEDEAARKAKEYRREMEGLLDAAKDFEAKAKKSESSVLELKRKLSVVLAEKEKLQNEYLEVKNVCEELMAMVEAREKYDA